MSLDCAPGDLSTCDFTAICVIGAKARKQYLLDVVKSASESAADGKRDQAAAGPAWPGQHDTLLPNLHTPGPFEDKANGPAVVQRLKINVPGVIEVNPQGGKVARMAAALAEWESGDWHVDRNAPWAEDFVAQITSFPNARHNDMCDAMSQAAAWLLQHRSGHGLRMTNAFTGEVYYECS